MSVNLKAELLQCVGASLSSGELMDSRLEHLVRYSNNFLVNWIVPGWPVDQDRR